jgi:hypothetical protein
MTEEGMAPTAELFIGSSLPTRRASSAVEKGSKLCGRVLQRE